MDTISSTEIMIIYFTQEFMKIFKENDQDLIYHINNLKVFHRYEDKVKICEVYLFFFLIEN
jgi:hypothetical protein